MTLSPVFSGARVTSSSRRLLASTWMRNTCPPTSPAATCRTMAGSSRPPAGNNESSDPLLLPLPGVLGGIEFVGNTRILHAGVKLNLTVVGQSVYNGAFTGYRPVVHLLKGPGLSAPLLTVNKLFCERDDRVLFSQLSFALAAGEIVQIEGQNGSGKTTLLRILSGLSRNYEGEIFWRGEPVTEVREQFCSEMLYFGHQAGVKSVLTPEENLRWYAALSPAIDGAAIADALQQVGLKGFEDVPCHSLSAGQNRRVSLARLYLSRAPLWILDEPFTAIDKRGVAAKEQLLLQHAQRGGSVILTTHHELGIHGPVRKINLDRLLGTSV